MGRSIVKYKRGVKSSLIFVLRINLKLFFREKTSEKVAIENSVPEKLDKKQNNLINDMKSESQKAELKNDILELLKKNPEMAKTLSIERLKEVIKMYDEKIEKNQKEIEYLEIKLNGYKARLS